MTLEELKERSFWALTGVALEAKFKAYPKEETDEVLDSLQKEIAKLKAEKEDLLVKFRAFIDDHCLKLVTATQAVENLSPHIQTDFYEEFIKEQK